MFCGSHGFLFEDPEVVFRKPRTAGPDRKNREKYAASITEQ
jgi:hypothetical protein